VRAGLAQVRAAHEVRVIDRSIDPRSLSATRRPTPIAVGAAGTL
jgi:hypothetical protein